MGLFKSKILDLPTVGKEESQIADTVLIHESCMSLSIHKQIDRERERERESVGEIKGDRGRQRYIEIERQIEREIDREIRRERKRYREIKGDREIDKEREGNRPALRVNKHRKRLRGHLHISSSFAHLYFQHYAFLCLTHTSTGIMNKCRKRQREHQICLS